MLSRFSSHSLQRIFDTSQYKGHTCLLFDDCANNFLTPYFRVICDSKWNLATKLWIREEDSEAATNGSRRFQRSRYDVHFGCKF